MTDALLDGCFVLHVFYEEDGEKFVARMGYDTFADAVIALFRYEPDTEAEITNPDGLIVFNTQLGVLVM